jgi:hypothetical protein
MKVNDENSRIRIRIHPQNIMDPQTWDISLSCSGSEADSIVYVLSGSHYETWQHVYTAVTRGKKHVIIIGTYAELEQAVK